MDGDFCDLWPSSWNGCAVCDGSLKNDSISVVDTVDAFVAVGSFWAECEVRVFVSSREEDEYQNVLILDKL
jgi:hypothetical protein